MLTRLRWLMLFGLVSLTTYGCQCQQPSGGGPWLIAEPPDDAEIDVATPDARAAADVVEDTVDIPPSLDAAPDTPPPTPWEPRNVPLDYALTDRTELVIDADGTFWIAFHSCESAACSQPMLSVARRPVGGEWTIEDIEAHEGIFGIEIIEPGRPVVVFTQSRDNTFKAATRVGDRQWEVHTLPVVRSGPGDGFDLTQDGERFYVTFAADRSPLVALFTKPAGSPPADFRARRPLEARDPQAAMGRGLRADTAQNAYLVHRNEEVGAYGVSRYDFGIDRWPQSTYMTRFGDQFVHSLIITRDFELCTSGEREGRLVATCGTLFNLEDRANLFTDQLIARSHPSSVVEGDDGTLYIAYNPFGNEELRVARLAPGRDFQSDWEHVTAFDGPSFGVSTAIDRFGNLAVSFYTCDRAGACTLKLLLEDPRSL